MNDVVDYQYLVQWVTSGAQQFDTALRRAIRRRMASEPDGGGNEPPKLSRIPAIIFGDSMSVKIKRDRSRAMAKPYLSCFHRGSNLIHEIAVKRLAVVAFLKKFGHPPGPHEMWEFNPMKAIPAAEKRATI